MSPLSTFWLGHSELDEDRTSYKDTCDSSRCKSLKRGTPTIGNSIGEELSAASLVNFTFKVIVHFWPHIAWDAHIS